MAHTLDTIIDFINLNIFTQGEYDALPQATRELYEKALEVENQILLADAAESARREEEEEQARLQVIWEASEAGSSESPSGAW